MISYKQRHALWQKNLFTSILLPLFILVSFLSVFAIGITENRASATTSSTLNFQGRLLTSTGGLVPDGSYNIEFKIYDDATAGTNYWTETRTGGSAVSVQNGYFSVYLGDVTAFGSTIPWDQELWMTMNVNSDGEMTPRFKLTAVPYAFRAGALVDGSGNAKTADDFAQLAPSSAQTINAALSALRLNQTGSGGLLQLQTSGVDVFTVDNTGATTIKGATLARNTTNSTSAFDVQNSAGDSFLKIDTTNAIATFGSNVGSSGTTLQGGTNGIQITSGANVNIGQSDTNGTLLVVDTKTDAGDPIGTNGAIYYNQSTQKFRCYENGAWIDCIGGAPYTGTSVNYVSGAQNIGANQTAFPLENMVFTSATGVSNVAAVNGGFTAAADGSFRSCLVMNTANNTAGTLSLRWRVNGVSVGSPACTMNNVSPTNRQSSTVLNPGVVTFQAGDIIDIAVDTSAAYAPTTTDYTVYWAVEYIAGSGGAGSGGVTLQDVYDQSLVASIVTANNKDILFNLANTAIDSDFVVNVASGSTSRLVVQNNGTDTFSVNAAGEVIASSGLTVGNSASTTAGTIRWTGTDFEGYDGANWISLTSGAGGGGGGVNVVSRVKQVNESVISSITLQDDDELTFPIGPNEEWTYRFVVQANAATAADLRFAVSAPSGAICNTATQEAENAASDAQVGCGLTSAILNGNATPELYEITGRVQNGPTAGNVTLRWAQFTSNATNTIVYAGSYVQAIRSIGPGGAGQPFAQSGNAFGTTAVLGTSDTQGLSIITDNTERIGISSTGNINIAGLTTVSQSLLANRVTTGITGITSGTGTNTTTLTLAADSFNVNDVLYIDNAGQDYYTRVIVDSGGGNYTVSPAVSFEDARTVTAYTIQNIGATATDYTSQANRFFQGYFLGGVVVGAGSTTISDGVITSTTGLLLQSSGGTVTTGGDLSVSGVITGDGSGLTNIDGSEVDGATITNLDGGNIATGTINDGRLSANVTLLGNTFNGVNQLVRLDGSGNIPTLNGSALTNLSAGNLTGALPAISGASLTSLNATNISSGTLADGRLSANVTLLGNAFNGASQLVQLTVGGALPALNGSALTSISGGNITGALAAVSGAALTNLTAGNLTGALPALDGSLLTTLNATNISSGTLNDGRLSANVTLLGNTFNGSNQLVRLTAGGALPVLDGSALTSISGGNITGALSAVSGAALTNLTAGNLTGALPAISGASLTSLNATNISSGTLADGRLSANVALLDAGQTFSALTTFGAGLSVTGGVSSTGAISGATVSGDGSALTSLNATNISSGTLNDGRLSSNVALLSGPQTFSGTKTFSGGLVLGLSTINSSATVARAVNLPDEAGTICLSNTNTCGFLRIAAGVLQTDATNNDVLAVNKTSATGNLINLQRSGTGVFTVANSGALQIQATSTTALNILNAGGTSYFSVDSSTGTIRIGSSVADATGVLFVLDTKNTAGDPTGVNGGMYYNSNLNKFRCFQDSVWRDCLPATYTQHTFFGAGIETWTNQPAADTEFLGIQYRMLVDLSEARQYRFVIARSGGTVTAGADCRVQYSATQGGVYANLDGAAGPEVDISGVAETKSSAWSNITAAGQADVYLRIVCKQGNGANDPQFRGAYIQVR